MTVFGYFSQGLTANGESTLETTKNEQGISQTHDLGTVDTAAMSKSTTRLKIVQYRQRNSGEWIRVYSLPSASAYGDVLSGNVFYFRRCWAHSSKSLHSLGLEIVRPNLVTRMSAAALDMASCHRTLALSKRRLSASYSSELYITLRVRGEIISGF